MQDDLDWCAKRAGGARAYVAAGIPWKTGIEGNEKVVITATVSADLTVQASSEKNKPSILDVSAGLQTLGAIEINLYRAEVVSGPALFDFVATGKSR